MAEARKHASWRADRARLVTGSTPLSADHAVEGRTSSEYYAPKNFNFWYFFGSLAMLVLVMQIVTGIFLMMHYKPDATLRLRVGRVHHARRALGLADPLHALDRRVGFFIVVYLHMFRGLLYGSYRKPRELIWLFGC